jgi:hypothetical protein
MRVPRAVVLALLVIIGEIVLGHPIFRLIRGGFHPAAKQRPENGPGSANAGTQGKPPKTLDDRGDDSPDHSSPAEHGQSKFDAHGRPEASSAHTEGGAEQRAHSEANDEPNQYRSYQFTDGFPGEDSD